MIKEQLQQGQLLPLMPKWQARGRYVQMLYPHRTYLPAKVRTFIEFMLAKIEPRKATL
ncbi:MAG: hypothetical protein GYB33_20690 [Gammaproteobacteria bacterium]|nr:hypothetical protein [Gammaproteobacteria bacterium]